MTSSMDPAALDWLRLGTSGRRVRGGGFLRRADWAGRDSEEELCSRVRRGRGLLEGTTLEPGLRDARSSGSLYGKERAQSLNGSTCCCQLTECSAKQGVKTRDKNMAQRRLCPSIMSFFLCWHQSKMCPYWFLSSTPRFLCCRGMLWITMRSFRLCWVAAAPTGTRPAWGMVWDQWEKVMR